MGFFKKIKREAKKVVNKATPVGLV